MSGINLRGVGVALVTPFRNDGNVDYEALERLIDYQIQNGVDYLLVFGTTGEPPTLTENEKKEIINFVVVKVAGRVPIVLGVGSNNTMALVEELRIGEFDGIDAILSVCPYYNKPSQEGIYQHFKAVAEASKLPVILYNIPGRTGMNMTAETILRIAHEFETVVAIKESSGNLEQIEEILKNKPKKFEIISGDDGVAFPLIALGASGVISVIANAFPKEFCRMTHLALEGDYKTALTIHQKFSELFKLSIIDGNPAGIKSILHIMGFIENKLRLPLVPARITTYEQIKNALIVLKKNVFVEKL